MDLKSVKNVVAALIANKADLEARVVSEDYK